MPEEYALLGGHLINPSQATLEYVNSQNNVLKQSVTITGESGGVQLTSYQSSLISQNFPYPVGTVNPTSSEQSAIQAYLRSAYFRSGDTVNIAVPEIAGYVAPTPSIQAMTVLGASTVKTLVYLTPEEVNSTNAGSDATLSDTGVDGTLIVSVALLILSLATIIVFASSSAMSVKRS